VDLFGHFFSAFSVSMIFFIGAGRPSLSGFSRVNQVSGVFSFMVSMLFMLIMMGWMSRW